MLRRTFARTIRMGRLTLRRTGQPDAVYGSVDPDRPNLDVILRVRDRSTEWMIAVNPDLHLGEAYMNGQLDIERGTIRDVLEILFLNFRHTESYGSHPGRRLWRRAFRRYWQRNSPGRARRNVAHHYDLSDDLYRMFLDEDRQYSCAYFESPAASLEEAQAAKKAHIIAKLLLRPGQSVLDIGSGWGGLALSLTRAGGGKVMGVTLSKEQLAVARDRAAAAGLADRVSFELQDYRELRGTFDRIVSVGMFEHVGRPNYRTFFDNIHRLLAPDGVALLHSIGRIDGPGSTNSWIRKYIFPGGHIPALSEVIATIEEAGFWVTDVEVLRLHYAYTLRHWQRRFAAHREEVARSYDDKFCRMWEFYLAASEMSFLYDGLMVFQIQLAKRVDAVPITRDYMVDAPEEAPTDVPARAMREPAHSLQEGGND